MFDSHPDLQRWGYSSTGLEWWSPKPQVIGSIPIALANFNSHFKLLIMVREYIIETLTKIKEYDEKIHSIYRMGIDLLDFDNLIDKIIYIDGDVEINLDNIEDFVDYLIREYGTNDIPTN